MRHLKVIKINLTLYLFIVLFIGALGAIYFMKHTIRDNSIEQALAQSKQMTNQLLIVRKYLAGMTPYVKVDDHHANNFALSPAFVGGEISHGMLKEHGFYIKQTALSYRNPNNQPDEYEKKVLNKYNEGKLHGDFWELSQYKGVESLRYTKPIYLQKACLSCHGIPHVEVPTKTYNQLIATYGDKSFDYKVGDLRGMISVVIPMTHLEASKTKLLNSSMISIGILFILLLIYIILERKLIFEPQMKESALKEEYEKTVIESNNNAIIAIDWTGKITTYNKSAQEMFGFSKEEMIGTHNLSKIMPQKDGKKHEESCKKYLKTGISCGIINKTHELEGMKKDGTVFPIKISFGSKWKPKNAIVVASIIDLTYEKEQQKLLNQQTKLASMGEMIGNIAHQWRQPLSVISTSATGIVMQKEYGILSDESLLKSCEQINNNAQFLSKTIDDFRDFIKGNSDKREFFLKDLFDNFLTLIEGRMTASNIDLVIDVDDNIKLYACENELVQCFINIFSNAVDVLNEKNIEEKFIKITAQNEHERVVIHFIDNGGGIEKDIIAKIFDPYFTTKHESQGTGLGLHMTYQLLVEGMDGTINVENQTFLYNKKEYTGAQFTITLPSYHSC
jgi:PAS domain S-box-containing protein